MSQKGSGSTVSTQPWDRIQASYSSAQQAGAAYQTDTKMEVIRDGGIDFVVRKVAALRDKPKGARGSAGAKPANPFLPYDEALWVGHLSDTHTLLLNKFNVVQHHLLVVTRQFESQLDWLTEADFEATCTVLQAFPSGALAFYNSGPASGASQPHKHVQVVPLPLGEDSSNRLPFAAVIQEAYQAAHAAPLAAFPLGDLPFQCWAAVLPDRTEARSAFQACRNLQAAAKLSDQRNGTSYNLWLADGLMLLAVRSQEACGPVAVNTLGFAGTILVKSDDQMQYLREHGPLHVLQHVGTAWGRPI